MYSFLEINKLLQDKQFGFRSKHSTTYALISLTESINNFLDKKEIVCGIFIDLEKAFDTVNHSILYDKLNYYGFRGKFNDLIKSYLTKRKQSVSINGYDSTNLDITCGVPQGSTLGPLLFLLYINDLQHSLKFAKLSHFADDTCLTYSNKNANTLETNLNHDLKNLTQWLRANRLSLNMDKTRLLIFKSKYNKNQYEDIIIKLLGKRVDPSTSVKYLGIHIDHNLSGDCHIKEMNAKLSRTNGILSTLHHYVPKNNVVRFLCIILLSYDMEVLCGL